MAFQKSFTLSSGVSGNYVRLIAYRWDRPAREATAIFALYLDAEAAASGKQAIAPTLAKLRLAGDQFDAHLGNAVLVGNDIVAQLYVAAKTEPLSCDFGDDAFANAQDV